MRDGQIWKTIVVGDDWTPPDAEWMAENDALAAGISRWTPDPVRPDDATMLQIMVWLARRGVSSAQLDALVITRMTGAELLEAQARMKYAWRVPFDNPLTEMLAGELGVTLSDVWPEILAIET